MIAESLLIGELKLRREKARARVTQKLDIADIEMIRGPAMRVCVAIDGLGEVGRLLVRDAVYRRFEAFARDADRLLRCSKSQDGQGDDDFDLHQLRIEGKALRYTLEMGELDMKASNGKGRPIVSERFKPLQDRLGRWHDRVVLGQVAIEWMSESQIVLHDDERAEAMLKYAAGCVRAGRAEIARFCDAWKASRVAIAMGIRNTYPLVKRVTARQTMENGSRSDPASKN
jgi:CHAD domain-containing protein